MVLARKDRIWWFAGLAGMVYLAVLFVSRIHTGRPHPGAVQMAAACDLLITVPALYYLLLVRPGHSSWSAMLAVFLVGARAVGFLMPAMPLRWLGVPLELWVIIAIARRLRRTRSDGDPVDRIRAAAAAVFRYPWIADVIATEFQVFYYALFAWRARPQSKPGFRSLGAAQASGYGMLSVLLMVAVVVEGVPLHLLLARWSHVAAWICTAAGVYSLLWFLALYRSLTLRTILIGPEIVLLQIGFLWRVEFRREQMRAMRRISAAEPEGMSLVVLNEPQWLIEFTEPVSAYGLLGRRKTITKIAVAADDCELFGAAFAGHCGGSETA
jgi:hypothetical protein